MISSVACLQVFTVLGIARLPKDRSWIWGFPNPPKKKAKKVLKDFHHALLLITQSEKGAFWTVGEKIGLTLRGRC
jgi:hypothetical protein